MNKEPLHPATLQPVHRSRGSGASGAWERERAEELSAKLGLVLAFDPLVDPRPAGPVAYARLRALGMRRSFSQAALEQTLSVLNGDGAEGDAFVAIDAPRSLQHALALQQLIAPGET